MTHHYLNTKDMKPKVSEIKRAEIAINFKDQILYTKDLEDAIIPVGASGMITQNMNVLDVDFELKPGMSGVVAGDFTIEDGVTFTIPDGSTLSCV